METNSNNIINYIDCTDIYSEVTQKYINGFKNFREVWLRANSSWNAELFQYADPDFYFYKFAIEMQEKNKEEMLLEILEKVFIRYGIEIDVPETLKDAPFAFIIKVGNNRIGYRFSDFFSDENIIDILSRYKVNSGIIIRTWKPGKYDEWIARENDQYQNDGLPIKTIALKTFFNTYFPAKEYESFILNLEKYLEESRNITGYTSIKFLSPMNMAVQKIYEEKTLVDWDYNSYKYQLIDTTNPKITNYLYLAEYSFSTEDNKQIREAYLSDKRYKSMIGMNEYAESFITSEWLFHSLREKKNFDYTSVVSGYLKSIEQLLYCIVRINIDNNCKISLIADNKIRKKASKAGVEAFTNKNGTWEIAGIGSVRYPYIEFTTEQEEYMDSSIGTFEHFIRNNAHIFRNPLLSTAIADMVSCFRTECRNGYFHTHNLKSWDIAKKTRENAIFLYYVLLGESIIPDEKKQLLGIDTTSDDFDSLCKRIREFRHYGTDFVFEYENGNRINLVCDYGNNTAEYTDEGIEHYQKLAFFKVENFSIESIQKLDENVPEDQMLYLTRETMPNRIYGIYHKNREIEELYCKY